MSDPKYPNPYTEDLDEQDAHRYTEEVEKQLEEIEESVDEDDVEDLRR